MKMTSRVLLPMYTDHQSVTAETLDCRKIFHRERQSRQVGLPDTGVRREAGTTVARGVR